LGEILKPSWKGAAVRRAGSHLYFLRESTVSSHEGVRVGFGTDAGMPGRFLGYFERRELHLVLAVPCRH